MKAMEIKHVDFLGDTLIEARDSNGNVWVGVSYICNGIGLTKAQKDTQVERVGKDKVLKQGCRKFPAGVFDPYNETVALKLDFLPLWLAKINITPSMEADSPDVADKLEAYQLKAKDVLAAAFLPTQKPMSTAEIVAAMAQNNVEMERKLSALQAESQVTKSKVDLLSRSPEYWRAEMDERIKRLAEANHMAEAKLRNQLYKELERAEAPIDLNIRLTRMRNRAKKQGALERTCKALTRLDVIAANKELRAEFERIVGQYDVQTTLYAGRAM